MPAVRPTRGRPGCRTTALAFCLAVGLLPGCAAFTNPVADGVPVRRLPEEVLGRPKSELVQVPLTLLRQPEQEAHKVDKGDVLGVLVEEVLGPRGQAPPVRFTDNPLSPRPAVTGYPVTVQDDGTILLPELPPLDVRGLTLPQVRERIIKAVTVDKSLIAPGRERVVVELMQPRRFQVMVVREDNQPFPQTSGQGGVLGGTKKGAGFTIYLDAYKNDVLRALNATGGPPGLDAKNEVIVQRGTYDPENPNKGRVRIPLRVRPDEPVTFTADDVVLKDGDILYIESRETEVYYTAGIMGAFQIPLPRDYDLRVIEAIAQVRGPLLNGGFSQNAFVAQATNTGIGNPNPSLVSVVRRFPNGQQVTIRVDLNLAFRDQRENILIQPGDIVVLQERPGEALTRYFTQTFRVNTLIRSLSTPTVDQTITSSNP